MLLPIKTRILQMAIELDKPITAQELAIALQTEYHHERTTTIPQIEKQLDMYCRVGMMTADEVTLDEKGELLVRYLITPDGKLCEKYIPE